MKYINPTRRIKLNVLFPPRLEKNVIGKEHLIISSTKHSILSVEGPCCRIAKTSRTFRGMKCSVFVEDVLGSARFLDTCCLGACTVSVVRDLQIAISTAR